MPGTGMLEIVDGLQTYSRALDDALKAQAPNYAPVLLTQPPRLRDARLAELSRLSNTLDHQWSMLLPIFEAIKSTKEELRRQHSICHSARSPVSAIPYEILSKIFFHAQESSNSDDSDDPLRDAMIISIRISQVCRDWRRVALHDKALWTTCRVSHVMDLKHMVPYLERCTNELFDLHVGLGSLTQDASKYPDLYQTLLSGSPLVYKLKKQLRKLVCNKADDMNGLFRAILGLDHLNAFRDDTRAKNITLSSLELITVCSGPKTVGTSNLLGFRGFELPALVSLHLVNTGIQHGSYHKLTAVESLYLSGRKTLLEIDLFELVRCTPKIKVIVIDNVCTRKNQDRTMVIPSPCLPALETVALVHTDEYIVCKVLGSFICPNLKSLSMSQIHCNSEIDDDPWTAASVGQANLPLVLSHSIHKTITHAPLLEKLKIHAPPEVLKALIHALSIPPSGDNIIPQLLEHLSIGFEGCRNRRTGEEETHTRRIGRKTGILLARALQRRKDHGCVQLCDLVVDSCMMVGRLKGLANNVEVRKCDCSEVDHSNFNGSDSE